MNSNERRNQLTTMKVAELKELAVGYELKVSGKKAEIIEKILNYECNLNNEENTKIQTIITSLKEMTNEEKIEVINKINDSSETIETVIKNVADSELARLIRSMNTSIIDLASEQVNVLNNLRSIALLYAKNNYTKSIIFYFIEILRYRIKEMQEEECKQEQGQEQWWNLIKEMNAKGYSTLTDRPLLQQILLHVCRDLVLDSRRAVKVSNGDKTVKQFGPTFVSKKHGGICMKDAMAKGVVKKAAEKVLSKEQQKKYITLNSETRHTEFKQAVQVLEKLSNAELIIAQDTDKEYAKFYSVNPHDILAFLQNVGCLAK
jgi:hypothetical protein